jgi:hypothetical protein
MKKKILYGLLALLVIIQFLRPTRNQAAELSANDISRHYSVPDTIAAILKRSCNDCHSNNTTYPWYSNIQPMGWWLQNHVNEGKAELNFSEFAAYAPKRQANKLEEVTEQVKDDVMPLNSYLWIHSKARLSATDKEFLIKWADSLRAEIIRKSGL